ncbi:MAG: O-Antigen ligase [Bacteroidetes bacterium ADurb.Bin217]|nr:MAG: O-Antigen ligase [Bacteroidetes bacterium ADurb.Bin217]
MWFGTGVIQITEKMAEQYAKQQTKMPEKYWKKPHNQFMLIAVQYGLVGFIIFIGSIIGMIIYSRKNLNILSICWLSICLISFFNEDMLDGIHGLVFFSFFASLFLCVQPVYNEVLNKVKKI